MTASAAFTLLNLPSRRCAPWIAAALLLSPLTAQADGLDPNTTDARAIAKAMEDRDDGDKSRGAMTITLTDGTGRTRVRKVRQQRMKFPLGQKSLMFFESPADVRNTGLLSIDYDDGAKDDDQWLYLPSLHKSTRISSSDKSGSFMGTDLTYADMTKKDTNVYDYKVIEASAKVDGEECWVIEARPKTDKERQETGYLKTHVWVSKGKLIPLQTKAWVLEGKKLKYMKSSDLVRIDGVWVAKKLSVRTVRNGKVESETQLETTDVRFNQADVSEQDFTERRLEKGL